MKFKISFKVCNSSFKKVLDPDNMINETAITVQTVTDPNLVYGTWVLVIATIIGIMVTAIYTKRSLNETKKSNILLEIELKSKLRPMFQLTDYNLTPQLNKNRIIFRANIKNYGTVPARKIIARYDRTNNKKLIDFMKEKDKLMRSFSIGTIQNEGLQGFEQFIEITEQSPMYYFIWLEYHYLDKKEESVVLCTINKNDWDNVKQEWFIQEDIDEARQEWEDIKSGKRFAPT